MATIANNETISIGPGVFAFQVTGALDLQMNISDGFTTLSDGSFTGVSDGTIELPSCQLKAINATTETIILKQVR